MKKITIFLGVLLLQISLFAQNQNCSIIDSVTIYADTTQIKSMRIIGNGYGGGTIFYGDTLYHETDTLWHYVVLTIDNNRNQKVYVDGELRHHFNINQNFNYSSLYIGAESASTVRKFLNGVVDEFRISNIVRSDTEILNNATNNLPLGNDVNTIELFRFNEVSGNTTTGENGTVATIAQGNPLFTIGKFSNGLKFDGIDDRLNCNINPPETNVTFEIWVKFLGETEETKQCIIQPYGYYSGGIYAYFEDMNTSYLWSTGDTTSSITINPSTDTLIWVSNGTCTDTIIFANSYQEIYDTTYISVTDTLIIDAILTGVNPPNNINTIKIYPNPAKTHIYINNGNYNLMNGYTIKIENSLGQTVYNHMIDQQEFYVDLSSWTGNGTYFVYIIDDTSNIIEVKKIIIQ